MFLATFSALGYGPWGDITLFKMQFLVFFDFITNSALMPVVATATCIFVGWVLTPKAVIDEVEEGGRKFTARPLYVVMVKYIAPAFMIAILVSEICRAFEIGGWSI
jgi:NSS family neurotransmitter:Na+ symporter